MSPLAEGDPYECRPPDPGLLPVNGADVST